MAHYVPGSWSYANSREFANVIVLYQAFGYFNLDWTKHVVIAPELFRPSDIMVSMANPVKARQLLSWHTLTKIDLLIKTLINANLC